MIDQPWKKQGPKPKRYPYKGRMLTVAELAEISGWSISAIYKRINSGLSIEKAADRASTKRPPTTASFVVTYRGEERTLSEWAEVEWVRQRGISRSDLYARIYQLGWSKEKAFGDVPVEETRGRKPVLYPYQGRQVTINELAQLSGLPVSMVRRMIKRGMAPEQVLEFDPNAEQVERDDDVNE